MIPLIAQLNKNSNSLERSVDLVDDSAIQNPYFRDEVDQTREPIYEAQQSSSPSLREGDAMPSP